MMPVNCLVSADLYMHDIFFVLLGTCMKCQLLCIQRLVTLVYVTSTVPTKTIIILQPISHVTCGTFQFHLQNSLFKNEFDVQVTVHRDEFL